MNKIAAGSSRRSHVILLLAGFRQEAFVSDEEDGEVVL